ncbi:hypothetical protein [Actinoplanes subtropicus]|uniref:hypothetical protein n=1 Tax=Actinoplanes subtropicus TaxID=543632 RepID=UPI0004C396B1|nr:hypothetical protein [Actinoplanes subtropicus]
MAAELTSADYAYLIILKAEDREISNTEMAELYGVRLRNPELKRLAGYVVSTTRGSTFWHVITDRGVRALDHELTLEQGRVPEGKRRTAKEGDLYWAAMLAMHKLLRRPPGKKVVPPPMDLADRVRAAYAELAETPGTWVKLANLRAQLADLSTAELDKTLEQMLDSPDVQLEPEALDRRIGPEERRAAVHIGGEDRHKLAIGVR